jgi:hypothetical protein
VADIFNEVDEDVRRDRYDKLWKAYGKYAVAVVVLVVAAVAGVTAWRDYERGRNEAFGAQFAKALETARAGSSRDAAAAFEQIARTAPDGYRALATLQEAAARFRDGDSAGALAAYDRLAADRSVDSLMRDLAALLSVLHRFDQANDAELLRRLEPLAKEAGAWRYSARELQGLIALRKGDAAAARRAFIALTDDGFAPPGIRARAAELLASLGG